MVFPFFIRRNYISYNEDQQSIMKEYEMEENESKIEKLKNHIKRNKKFYIGTGIGLAIGAIGATLLKKQADQTAFGNVGDQSVLNIVQAEEIEHLCQRISIYGNVIGRHGNPVREIDPVTGRTIHEFATQKLAALNAGVSKYTMSKHLDGESLNLNGRTFERMSLEWITLPSEKVMFEY
jgi:hypothetical protein